MTYDTRSSFLKIAVAGSVITALVALSIPVKAANCPDPVDVDGDDGRQISRYENGRITPSLDALVRLAETFNISLDHRLIDDIPARPLHIAENALGDRLHALTERDTTDLDTTDLDTIRNIIDGLLAKRRLRTIAGIN